MPNQRSGGNLHTRAHQIEKSPNARCGVRWGLKGRQWFSIEATAFTIVFLIGTVALWPYFRLGGIDGASAVQEALAQSLANNKMTSAMSSEQAPVSEEAILIGPQGRTVHLMCDIDTLDAGSVAASSANRVTVTAEWEEDGGSRRSLSLAAYRKDANADNSPARAAQIEQK